MITPQAGVVLVALSASNYGAVPLTEKTTFDSITSGTIIAISPLDEKDLTFKVGDMGYWRQYKDDARVKGDKGEKQALIEIKDILGTSHV